MSIRETRWWWIRHAPVPDEGRIYGQSDLSCDCGETHIFEALARTLPREAVWVTSNLRRTHETAAAILAAAAHAARPEPLAVPDFAEQHLGEWQGQVRAEFHAARMTGAPRFWFSPASERAPGGESFDEMVARVTPQIDRLTREHAGRDIVAVTHGGTIRAALAHALGVTPEAALAFVIENCSVTRLDHLHGGAEERWRVVSVNHRPWLGAVQDDRGA
ncbi:MAG: alpha-ribazole phosphatase [Variibacter sp.]|jgi:broad specificity phosphatase PhoE|nr:alpha-ribazole phosphatase [Variibacter sp.]